MEDDTDKRDSDDGEVENDLGDLADSCTETHDKDKERFGRLVVVGGLHGGERKKDENRESSSGLLLQNVCERETEYAFF